MYTRGLVIKKFLYLKYYLYTPTLPAFSARLWLIQLSPRNDKNRHTYNTWGSLDPYLRFFDVTMDFSFNWPSVCQIKSNCLYYIWFTAKFIYSAKFSQLLQVCECNKLQCEIFRKYMYVVHIWIQVCKNNCYGFLVKNSNICKFLRINEFMKFN